jgi:hypothetical protein
MNRVPAGGRLFALAAMLSTAACGALGPSAIEAEPTVTPDIAPIAASACAAWINDAQIEMDTFKDGLDAAKAQSLCTVWLDSNWNMADNQSYLLAQTAVVHIDEEGLPINDRRGHDLAVMLQNKILTQLHGTPTPAPAPLTVGE